MTLFCVHLRSLTLFAAGLASVSTMLLTSMLMTSPARAGEVVSVFPTGSVKQVQQITARFSTDMVPMGDPRSHKDPIAITCNDKAFKKVELPKASSRWIDNKNWSYDFTKPLPSGVRCAMKIVVEKDLKGEAVTGVKDYTVSTGGPVVLGVVPRYGEIEPGQYFVIETDGPMDLESLKKGAYFETAQVMSRIGVRLIEGKDREKVLRAAIESDWRLSKYRPLLESKKPLLSYKELSSVFVIAANNRFPESSRVTLHWSKDIRSASGLNVEEPQKFEFQVIPPFEATFTCERVNPDRPCNPILGMRLEFSRTVDRKLLEKVKLVGPKGVAWTPDEFNKELEKRNRYRDSSDFISALTFSPPFPDRSSFTIALPKLKDELGRALVNQNKFPLEVKTDEFIPLVKFAAGFGILELKAEPALPVSLRNVEKTLPGVQASINGKSVNLSSGSKPREIIELYRRLQRKDDSYQDRADALLEAKEGKSFSLPKPGGEREFELVGIPLKEPGFHVVELRSPKLGGALLGEDKPMYVASGALVTNLGVHLKKGRESSAVWVTTLDTAKPVSGAEVALVDGGGKVLAKGKTDASGLWHTGTVEYPCSYESSDSGYGDACEVFAFATSGSDMSFVSSSWSRGIEEYRFNLSSEYLDSQWGPIAAHTVLDRSLIQAGETLHMKTFLREYTSQGFRAFDPKRVPKRILIVHRGTRKTFAMPFEFDSKTGAAANEFKVPKDATLGFYEIYLSTLENPQGEEAFDWSARSIGNFIVAEYRLPMMESTVKIQGGDLIRPKDVKVDLSASYLAGGPARDLKVKVRAALTHGAFNPDTPNASEYTFFSRPMKVGTAEGSDVNADRDLAFLFNQDVTLGSAGGAVAVVKGLPESSTVRSLTVEMEYRDPNGEVKTGRAEKMIYPSEAIVGVRTDSWFSKAGQASVLGLVLRPDGKPLANHSYVVEAFRQEYLTHRKRLVGGFYSYDSSSKTVAMGPVCEGKTGPKGEFTCVAKKLPSGSVTLQARVADRAGRTTVASTGLSIYEEGDFSWWTPSDSDRIDLLPEKTSYQPEDTAKFVLRSPFPVSTVLVTVEREGVLDAFVREVPRDNPVLEVPLKGSYAPNVFVSALAIRGRVGDPKPTALLDLSKPAMKLGISEIKVGWKAHQLNVAVTTDKKRYHVRDKVPVTIKVTKADGSALVNAETEVAIAVVDESLSLLRKNWSLDLLAAMMKQRPLAVSTASAQNQIIGRRHFGSKAKPQGGDGGGGQESRELFDPMLLWTARVKVDGKGEAKITVPLNDSMTSFRISAVASSQMNFFGSGSTVIQSSKDLILYSGFAPVVRDGDEIKNQLTVRNTTENPMRVELALASPQIKNLPKLAAFEVKPSESKVVSIPVKVPHGLKLIEYDVVAKDLTGGYTDRMKFKTRVDEAVPDQVLQATLFQLDGKYSIPVQQPKDALPGRGGLVVESRSTLLTSLSGVKSYMEAYPYSCLEQQVSKAVSLEDTARMKEILAGLPAYFDGRGLLKFFPGSLCGSAELTRYVLAIMKANGQTIPPDTLKETLAGLELYLEGRNSCSTWWGSFQKNTYRDQQRLLVMETLSSYGRFEPKWLTTIQQTPNIWKTTTVVAWNKLLAREASIPNRDVLLKQAENILRARVNYQGSLMSLQGGVDWEASWSLFVSRDQEAIEVLGLGNDQPSWHGDIGRLARGVTARMKHGKWDTTLANAWGTTELRRFASKFEKDKVAGTSSVKSLGVDYSLDWAKKPAGEKTTLAWPKDSIGKPQKVDFAHQGAGKPWVLLQTRSAIPLTKPWDLGYTIVRKVTKVSGDGKPQVGPVTWKNGDVANIELTVTAKYDHPWVVIRDPIPAGASHLGTGLEGESMILDRTPKVRPTANQILPWPAEFEEKTQSHFIAYAAYLMKGTYKMNYRIRLNSEGMMKLPPSHIEAMYVPETFGETPIAPWIIAP